MALPPSGIVTVRLPPADADDIDRLIDAGRFTNRSDFLRHAIRMAILAAGRDEAAADDYLAGPGALASPGSGRERRRATPRGVTKQ